MIDVTNAPPAKQVFPLISKQTLNSLIGKSQNIYSTRPRRRTISQSHQSLYQQNHLKKGEYVFNLRVKTGDHLSLTDDVQFQKPKCGDIAIFTISHSIPSRSASALIAETFYSTLSALVRIIVTLAMTPPMSATARIIWGRSPVRRIDSAYAGFPPEVTEKVIVQKADQHIEVNISRDSSPVISMALEYGNQISVNPGHYPCSATIPSTAVILECENSAGKTSRPFSCSLPPPPPASWSHRATTPTTTALEPFAQYMLYVLWFAPCFGLIVATARLRYYHELPHPYPHSFLLQYFKGLSWFHEYHRPFANAAASA